MSTSVSPAEIVQTFLISEGDVSDPDGSSGGDWPAYINFLPDGVGVPDNAVAVYDNVGQRDGRLHALNTVIDHPGFQVVVRATTAIQAHAKMKNITIALRDAVREVVVIAGNAYTMHSVQQLAPALSLRLEPGTKRRFQVANAFHVTLTEGQWIELGAAPYYTALHFPDGGATPSDFTFGGVGFNGILNVSSWWAGRDGVLQLDGEERVQPDLGEPEPLTTDSGRYYWIAVKKGSSYPTPFHIITEYDPTNLSLAQEQAVRMHQFQGAGYDELALVGVDTTLKRVTSRSSYLAEGEYFILQESPRVVLNFIGGITVPGSVILVEYGVWDLTDPNATDEEGRIFVVDTSNVTVSRYIDVTFDGTYAGSVEVTIEYDGSIAGVPEQERVNITMWQIQGAAFVPLSNNFVEPVSNRLTASTTSIPTP
jgi:hypothetical protein